MQPQQVRGIRIQSVNCVIKCRRPADCLIYALGSRVACSADVDACRAAELITGVEIGIGDIRRHSTAARIDLKNLQQALGGSVSRARTGSCEDRCRYGVERPVTVPTSTT